MDFLAQIATVIGLPVAVAALWWQFRTKAAAPTETVRQRVSGNGTAIVGSNNVVVNENRPSSEADGFAVDSLPDYVRQFHRWAAVDDDGMNAEWYYKPIPQLRMVLEDAQPGIGHHTQEWANGEVRHDRDYSCWYVFWYGNTNVGRVPCVGLDDSRKFMAAPNWEPMGTGRFYFYEPGTLRYAMQEFFLQEHYDRSSELRVKYVLLNDENTAALKGLGWRTLTIPVVSASEARAFIREHYDEKIDPESDKAKQYNLWIEGLVRFQRWLPQ